MAIGLSMSFATKLISLQDASKMHSGWLCGGVEKWYVQNPFARTRTRTCTIMHARSLIRKSGTSGPWSPHCARSVSSESKEDYDDLED